MMSIEINKLFKRRNKDAARQGALSRERLSKIYLPNRQMMLS